MPVTCDLWHRATLHRHNDVLRVRTSVKGETSMRAIISVLTSVALVGVASSASAQKNPAPKKEPLQSERDGCFKSDNATECRFTSRASFDSVLAKRAVLGVS